MRATMLAVVARLAAASVFPVDGFGHGLDRPKANRAAMQQNRDWFGTYLWPGEKGTAAQ